MLFVNAIEIYLDWKQTHASKAPDRYLVRLNQLADFLGRDKLLSEVSGDDIIKFHRNLSERFYQNGTVIRKYSLSTVAYSAHILKNFFSFWQGRKETIVNPKEILPIRHVIPLKKIVTLEDFEIMSASLSEGCQYDLARKLAIHLLWDSGMRVSELCDLNISDINSMHPSTGLRSATIRTRKTMRYNVVVWSKRTDELLNKYLGIRLCSDIATDALFIPSQRQSGKGITVRGVQRWIRTIVETTDLPKGITAHSFRHGKAHHILNTQGNVRDIFVILRHVRPESSFHYLNLNQEQFMQTAAKYFAA